MNKDIDHSDTIARVTAAITNCTQDSDKQGVFLYVDESKGTLEVMAANVHDLDILKMCGVLLQILRNRTFSELELSEVQAEAMNNVYEAIDEFFYFDEMPTDDLH